MKRTMDTWVHNGFNTTLNRSIENDLTSPFGYTTVAADFQNSILKETWRPNQLATLKQPILVKQEATNTKT